MIGVLVNTVAVIMGSLIGILFNKGIPEKLSSSITVGLGLATMFVGISGALEGKNILIVILSIAIGAIIGTCLDIDKQLNRFGSFVENKFSHGNKKNSVAQGFVTASLVFCVGAMTIVGSLNAGIKGDNTMLFTKSLLDFMMSIVFASTMGVGVALSAVFVFVFQGSIALLSGVLAPLLSEAVIAEMTCTGSILVFAIGANLAGLSKFKVANYLPAIFIPILLCPLYQCAANFLVTHF